ncbi:MAG: hypothetical protein J6P83_01775 [Bacteroidales bacterium]|nr:hypothetical protein [Bacteroidales bacterium]
MDFGKLFSKVVKTVKENIEVETKPASQPTAQPKPASRPTTPAFERERTALEWVAYFKEILATEFSQYSVRENVAVTDVAGYASDEFKLYKSRPTQAYKAEWGQPYTFVLEQAGSLKGVVMLGNGHSHDSNVKYLIARMYAKKMGIPYINFYTQMPNERDYVIGRIRKFL